MEVNINEITSTVRAVDGESLLAPSTMRKIVQVVLEAVRAEDAHKKRAESEQKVTQGIREGYGRE